MLRFKFFAFKKKVLNKTTAKIPAEKKRENDNLQADPHG